jgi:hypothetical protein
VDITLLVIFGARNPLDAQSQINTIETAPVFSKQGLFFVNLYQADRKG